MAVTKSLPTSGVEINLTVGDLITLTGLTPLQVPSPDKLETGHLRVVTGACIVERPGAVEQLEAGWLAVTEGSGFPIAGFTDPISRDFIRQLDIRGAAGLVVRLGHGWDAVPLAMIDEAQHLFLPIFTLPGDETPAMLLRLVHQAVGQQEIAVLRRALSVQTELIDALTYPDVERELINRLSTRLGVSAILYDSTRNVLASQGEAPVHLIRDRIRSDTDAETNFMVGRWEVSVAPISVPAGTYWLALAWHESIELSREIIRSTRYALQQLLRTHLTTQQNSKRHDLIQRAELLAEIIDGLTSARLARLGDRLVLLHFPRDGSFQIHAMQHKPSIANNYAEPNKTTPDIDSTLGIIQDTAEACGISVLLAEVNNHYLILLPRSEVFTRELLLRTSEFDHGTSSAFSDLTEARLALRQAEMSLHTSVRNGALTPFDQVGFINFILAQVPAETFDEKVDEVMSGLLSSEPMEKTVIAFLRNGMDIQATARSMHLHPNSIRYRLSRVENYLGRSMSDPETVTLLFLALHDRLDRAPALKPGVEIDG